MAGTIAVLILSVRHGAGEYFRLSDYAALAFATLGLGLWYYTETAAYALAITIGISFAGGALTIAKAYRSPESETLLTWVLSLIAAILALIAVGQIDLVLLAYPLYLLTLYALFIGAILLGRRRLNSIAVV